MRHDGRSGLVLGLR